VISHYWDSDIFGEENWFLYIDMYRKIFEATPVGGHIVEIGAFLGRSTSFLAVEAQHKKMRIDVVDTWLGSQEHQNMEDIKNGCLFGKFLKNLEPVINNINVIRAGSLRAVRMYDDASLDAVFIDGDHSYNAVKSDIIEWRKKVKSGGILAGDDYHSYVGVKKAVDELIPNRLVTDRYWHTIV
jgi:hypothetical protein